MKYFIKTFGCQMNFSDSERMASFFEQNNFKPTDKIDQADLIIFNTCGVRQMSEHKVYGHVHNVYKKDLARKKIIVVTGCLAHREEFRQRLEKKVDLFVSIKDFPKILKLIQKNKTKFFHSLENEIKNKYLEINPKYEKDNSALVPIMTGCNNFCTYCIVPYARGREWSRPFPEIQAEIKKIANKKYETITLLGQNVNSYLSAEAFSPVIASAKSGAKEDKDQKISFPKLLETLAQEFPTIKFKFLTSHPKDYSEQLIDVIARNENIVKEIHLPIQSGSDKILKAMNRPYTQKHYLDLIKKTLTKIPKARFSTDVIVGFPGETKKDFEETVKVFKKIKFSEAFINKYSPRSGTASFKLKDSVSLDEKKQRERELKKYF